jgi:hypothetical protein
MKITYRVLALTFLAGILCVSIYFSQFENEKNCSYISEKQNQTAQKSALFPIVRNSKWGFIEASGRIAISPEFDQVKRFSQDRAPFKSTNNGKWGFIDSTGRVVVEPQFDNAFPFIEGRAIIQIARRFGFIDSSGKTIVEPSFQEVYNFSEERSFVKESPWKWRMIDRNGKLGENTFRTVTDFSSGLAAVSGINNSSKRGFINPDGKVVIELDHILIPDDGKFVDELSLVKVRSPFYWYHYFDYKQWDKIFYGFINKKGATVIPFKYDVALNFSECLAPVWIKGKAGLINTKGKTIFTPQYDSIGNFSEGLATFEVGKPTPSILNAEKKWELAPVKYGYIDRTGKIVIQPKFSYGNKFYQGRAAVKTSSGTWGYIDQTGKFVGKAQFDFAFPFRNGLAVAITKDGWGYVDRQSRFVWFTTEPPLKDRSVFYTLY